MPFVLSLAEGNAFGSPAEHPYTLDPGIWARFFVAVGVFILAERQVEIQLHSTLGQLVRAPILSPQSFGDAAAAVATALRRRDSPLAEGICLLLAIAATIASYFNALLGS